MKKTIIISLAVLALAASCGRTKTTSQHEADQRSFNAWVKVQKELHPEYLWQPTELGSWLLEETVGTGEAITGEEDTLYVRVNYILSTLKGDISSTTYAKVAQQLGTYSENSFYGPAVLYLKGQYAGLEELLTGMRSGGRRKAAIPGWLLTYKRYDSPEKYLNDSTSTTPGIYDIELVDHFSNTDKWELDSIGRYLVRHFPKRYGTDPVKAVGDSSGAHGFYYIQSKAPSSATVLKDTAVYINYIGRLLDGSVFDTNVRDTAMRHGIYKSNGDYSPVYIKYGDDWSEIRMGTSGSSVVKGFALTLSKMGPFEEGTGIFYSPLGYSYSGSGSTIPGYSPLRFDISIVKQK